MKDTSNLLNELATIQQPNSGEGNLPANASEMLLDPRIQELKAEVNQLTTDDVLKKATLEGMLNPDIGGHSDMSWLYPPEEVQQAANPSTNYTAKRDSNNMVEFTESTGEPVELPEFLQDLTGAETVQEAAMAAGKTAVTGLLGMANPVLGLVTGAFMSAIEDPEQVEGVDVANAAEDIGLGITGLSLVTDIAESVGEGLGIYAKEDGIVNSIIDVMNGDETSTTLAGYQAAGGVIGEITRNETRVQDDGSLDFGLDADTLNDQYGLYNAGVRDYSDGDEFSAESLMNDYIEDPIARSLVEDKQYRNDGNGNNFGREWETKHNEDMSLSDQYANYGQGNSTPAPEPDTPSSGVTLNDGSNNKAGSDRNKDRNNRNDNSNHSSGNSGSRRDGESGMTPK